MNIAALASENATATVKAVISDLKTSVAGHEAALSTIASSTDATSTDTRIDSILSKVKTEISDLGDGIDASSSATSTRPHLHDWNRDDHGTASTTATTTIEVSISASSTIDASTTLESKDIDLFLRSHNRFIKK